MEYKDLHWLLKLFFFTKRHSFSHKDIAVLDEHWGPLQKGTLPWQIQLSLLAGVLISIAIMYFEMWAVYPFILGFIILYLVLPRPRIDL